MLKLAKVYGDTSRRTLLLAPHPLPCNYANYRRFEKREGETVVSVSRRRSHSRLPKDTIRSPVPITRNIRHCCIWLIPLLLPTTSNRIILELRDIRRSNGKLSGAWHISMETSAVIGTVVPRVYALTCSRNGMQERRTVCIHRNVLAGYAHARDSIIATRRGWPRLRRVGLEHDSPCSDVTRDATPYFSPLRKCLPFSIFSTLPYSRECESSLK